VPLPQTVVPSQAFAWRLQAPTVQPQSLQQVLRSLAAQVPSPHTGGAAHLPVEASQVLPAAHPQSLQQVSLLSVLAQTPSPQLGPVLRLSVVPMQPAAAIAAASAVQRADAITTSDIRVHRERAQCSPPDGRGVYPQRRGARQQRVRLRFRSAVAGSAIDPPSEVPWRSVLAAFSERPDIR